MNPYDIMKASQIACCLEVSSFKPGNVHRNREYDDIKYHHFLSSGIAFGNVVYEACQDNKDIGKYIKLAVIESKKWSPTNANLGIIMLHIPIAMSSGKIDEFDENTLKKEIISTTKNTTVNDAVNVYEAIEIAIPNINPPKEGPDAQKNDAKQELIEKNLTLYDVFKISSTWDSISKEWAEGFNISFKGYNLLNEYYNEYNNINLATTKTFLSILSEHPDTLIARKKDLDTSKMVSEMAKNILDEGFKKEDIEEFDKFLSKEGNKLNPGTTADLVASSLMIFLLDRIDKNDTILW
ncbi:triphosphoribosyl-dephospho-CoA synthase [Methanothermococcus sp.]|uniref:triphosphoribosyl-dephospho-CoA synthase n=1 Tax=Methanothermococcus sp. TaxID=2614238 RepID=UPI0025DC344D|nr:triphosphoribosyl-dephospho-CoA synthase [Methanothermococcus sp.]